MCHVGVSDHKVGRSGVLHQLPVGGGHGDGPEAVHQDLDRGAARETEAAGTQG